jgi:hypothetical protein
MIISHRHFLPSLVTQRTKIVLESQSFFKTWRREITCET